MYTSAQHTHFFGQVSEEERKMQYDHLFKDIAGVLVDKCVNPGKWSRHVKITIRSEQARKKQTTQWSRHAKADYAVEQACKKHNMQWSRLVKSTICSGVGT